MQKPSPARRPRPSEEGYVLVAVMFLLVVLVLALSVAVPRVRASIQLDRERETMQRGKQYARAIKLYYKKFNRYPPNIDALVMTNNIRFLRKRYVDPMTGKDDWRPIHFGENKTPIAMGFFGQALATGSTLAGTGTSGGNSINGSSGLFNNGSGSSSPFSPTSPTSPGSPTSPTDGTSGTGTGGTGSAFGSGGTSGTAGTSGTNNGPTFGGAGIIGFAPGKDAASIMLLKKKSRYNEWEFLYSPAADRVVTFGGGPVNGANPVNGGSGGGFSGGGGSGGFSGGGGFNGGGSGTPTPQPPSGTP